MRSCVAVLVGVTLLVSASQGHAKRTVEEVLPAYSKAYDTAFKRLQSVQLSDTQTRITRMAQKGKPFQAELDALRRRQGEVSDLLVKAVEQKKKAQADKPPDAAQVIEDAIRILEDADKKAVSLRADLTKLDDKLTAAGAPKIDPGPPRDPNARD